MIVKMVLIILEPTELLPIKIRNCNSIRSVIENYFHFFVIKLTYQINLLL